MDIDGDYRTDIISSMSEIVLHVESATDGGSRKIVGCAWTQYMYMNVGENEDEENSKMKYTSKITICESRTLEKNSQSYKKKWVSLIIIIIDRSVLLNIRDDSLYI